MAKSKTPTLRVFRNDILFQFESEAAVLRDKKLAQKGFKEKTSWGFEFVAPETSAGSARWGIVVSIGPEIVDAGIKIGSRILIENLKWTNAIEFDGAEYWKTNEDQVLLLDEGNE